MPAKRKDGPAYNCEENAIRLILGVPHPSKEYLAELRPVWRCCGPALLAEWMNSRKHPGERPFAWWLFSAPCKRDYREHPNAWDFLNAHDLMEPWEYGGVNAMWRGWFGDDYFESE
jgi:hypothetical protein